VNTLIFVQSATNVVGNVRDKVVERRLIGNFSDSVNPARFGSVLNRKKGKYQVMSLVVAQMSRIIGFVLSTFSDVKHFITSF